MSTVACYLHAWPGPGRTALRPVDDVQVDVVDVQLLQAALDRCDGILPPGMELGRDEHLFARNAALEQPLADALLVAVGLCRVDVSVSELERPAHRIDAFPAVLNLPDAESEQRYFVPVRKHTGSSIYCQRVR